MTDEQRQAIAQAITDKANGVVKPVAETPIVGKQAESVVIPEKVVEAEIPVIEDKAKPVVAEKSIADVPDFDEEGVFVPKVVAETPIVPITPEAESETDTVISRRFGKNAVEIQKALEYNESIQAELQTLKAELEKARSAPKPKLADIAKEGYDAKELDELVEYVNLIKKDTSKMSDVDVLKEAFVLDNKNLSRADAEKKFTFAYKRMYDVSGLDVDENADEIEERQFNLDTDSKMARLKLNEAIKNAIPPAKAEAELTPENVILKKSVELHVQSIPQIIASLPKTKTSQESIVEFKSGNDSVKISLTADEQAQLQRGLEYHLSGESNYDKEGKLSHGNPKEVLTALAHNIFIEKERAAWIALGAKQAKEAIYDQGKVKIGQQKQNESSGKVVAMTLREAMIAKANGTK